MKALSIKQPWLNWILQGRKTIETRTWKTSYRGDILLCASQRVDWDAWPQAQAGDDAPLGHALAVVNLSDIRPMTKEDEAAAMCPTAPDRYAWLFDNVRPILPVPVSGKLALFEANVPIILAKAVGALLLALCLAAPAAAVSIGVVDKQVGNWDGTYHFFTVTNPYFIGYPCQYKLTETQRARCLSIASAQASRCMKWVRENPSATLDQCAPDYKCDVACYDGPGWQNLRTPKKVRAGQFVCWEDVGNWREVPDRLVNIVPCPPERVARFKRGYP